MQERSKYIKGINQQQLKFSKFIRDTHMVIIKCDFCSSKYFQNQHSSSQSQLNSIPQAKYIHVNTINKISLLCNQCLLENAQNEIFYLPIQSQETEEKALQKVETEESPLKKPLNKYLKRVTENYLIKNKEQVKRRIEGMLKKDIFEPFTLLEKGIQQYKNTLNEYKKMVRAQFKGIMSKMDYQILQSFREIVLQMHSQSNVLERGIKRSINLEDQEEENNQNNLQRHIVRPQFSNREKEELDILIAGMKVSAENEWGNIEVLNQAIRKSYEKFKNVFQIQQEELTKKTTLLKKIIPKITVAQQYQKLIEKKASAREWTKMRNSNNENATDVQEIDCEENEENEESQKLQRKDKGRSNLNDGDESDVMEIEQESSSDDTYVEVKNKPGEQIMVISQDEDENEGRLKSNLGFGIAFPVIDNQPGNNNDSGRIWIGESEKIANNIQQLIHLQGQQQNAPQSNIEKTAPGIGIEQIPLSINLDQQQEQQSNSVQFSHTDNKKSASINSKLINHPPIPVKDASNNPPPYQDFQSFQIGVQNYQNPLQSLKTFFTLDFQIKRSLQKNKVTLPPINLLNFQSPKGFSPLLKLIKKLKLSYTRKKHLQSLLKLISQSTNLQSLTITEPLLATQELIHFFITSFPKLKCLQFLCFNKLNETHLSLIAQKLPELQELYYGPKCYKNIALKSQFRQFRQHKKQKRLISLNNSSLINFLNCLTSIKNIWISEHKDMEKILQYLQTKNNFHHLIIGKYLTDSTQVQLTDKSWHALTKLTNLHSLALLNIKIDTPALETLLKNNSLTLHSLQIYSCTNWTDQLASHLKKCRSLKQFYLFNSDDTIFDGHTLWDAVTLETLVLRSCQFMNFEAAQKKIHKLNQLKHIDLYGCEWVKDTIVHEVSKSKQITFLNLANTDIGSSFQQTLFHLYKIRCLALGSTRINAASIEGLCTEFPEMEKLSLYNLKGSPVVNGRCMVKKNRLNKIGDILKNLKYLDIGSLDTADDSMFDHFKNIKSIYLWMSTKLTPKKIKEVYLKGVNVIDDA